MWLRCYECGKKTFIEKRDNGKYYSTDPYSTSHISEEWHLDIYRSRKRDRTEVDYRNKKYGHPSMKIFLCDECYHKHDWIG